MKKITLIIAAILVISPFTVMADNDWSDLEVSHPLTEENPHWTVESSGVYLGLGVKHNWEAINNSFEVGILNIVSINYNSLHGQNLSLGVGFHHRSYSMKRPGMLVRDNNGVVSLDIYPQSDIAETKNRTSNLNVWAMQLPLIFRQRIYKKFMIGVGGIMNWNFNARADNHYNSNKTDYDTHFKGLHQNKVNFDLIGSLNIGGLGVYCRYSPAKFFKEDYGPEIKNTWTLGLVLGM